MSNTTTSEIIGLNKYNPEGELIVVLFELCDLACQFCAQDHSSVVGMDTIKEKSEIVAKNLELLKARGKTSVSVNIMGGELFSDKIEDRIIDDYAVLVERIRSSADAIDLPVNINFATNLVWTKTDRVMKLIEKTGVPLAASYDPAGRFNPTTLQTFIDNCKTFKDHITQIGIVMTKPNMDRFMKKSVPEFDFLYENFTIVFDHYTHSPSNNLDFLLPEDVVIRDFYKFMIDNYPKAYPFAETVLNTSQPMGCMRTMYVFADNTWGPCGSYEGLAKKNTIETIRIVDTLEKKVETTWYEDYDCLSCEHMQRCSFSCFLNNHFYDKQRTQEACCLKEVYDYVDSK
jgi:hypothetical protein